MSESDLRSTTGAGAQVITRESAPMPSSQGEAELSFEDRGHEDVDEVVDMLIRVPSNADCPGCHGIGGGHTCPACVVEALAENYPDATEEEVRATLLAHRPTLVSSLKRWIASLLRNA